MRKKSYILHAKGALSNVTIHSKLDLALASAKAHLLEEIEEAKGEFLDLGQEIPDDFQNRTLELEKITDFSNWLENLCPTVKRGLTIVKKANFDIANLVSFTLKEIDRNA